MFHTTTLLISAVSDRGAGVPWQMQGIKKRNLWQTNAEGRLLAYLCKVAENYEPQNNLTQYLLFGPRAFHVLHPSNVVAVLSTNFKGD